MALDVKVTIDMAKTVGTLGFGYPLILVENATNAVDYTVCSDIAAVVKAGFDDKTDAFNAAQLMFMQNHKPAKIAVCATTGTAVAWLAESANIAKEWRQLVVINEGETASGIGAIAAAVESAIVEKMYFATIPLATSEAIEGVEGCDRTVLFFYDATEDIPVPSAALAGELGGLTCGSYTVNNMLLTGLTPLELSKAEIEAIHALKGITYVLSAGDGVCSEGIVASGEFIDNVDNNDYIKQQLEYKTQKVLNNNLKVPYTNVGIAMLEAAALSVMKDAQNKGIVETFTVNYALREETSVEDRAARKYFGGNVAYSMQGAIHEVEIFAEASV